LDKEEITPMAIEIKHLPSKSTSKEITTSQGSFNLGIEKDTEINGIGMGVLSDGTPYLNQRGLAALCGVQNAHIGTISSQWSDPDQKPRIKRIKDILNKMGARYPAAHVEVVHKGTPHYCYPADICLAALEYYAFDAGPNCQEQAKDNFRLLAGSKLRELIYSQVGYDPTKAHTKRFEKWHERIALNYQSAPKGFFHVFNEAHTLIYELIIAGADIGEHFVVDISIGQIGESTGQITILTRAMAAVVGILIVTPRLIRSLNPIRKNLGATHLPPWLNTESGFRAHTSKGESSAPT
jgi:hypothetical protein